MNSNIAKFSSLQKFPKGQVIVREGDDTAKVMVILLQGSVGIYKNFGLNGQSQVSALSQGSFFGEMPLFLSSVPDHTLVALTDVLAILISRKNVYELFTSQPEMTFTIIESICKKLEAADAELNKFRPQANETASKRSELFPKGHGSYMLNLCNDNRELLFEHRRTCPICGQSFEQLTILPSKLRMEKTEMDLRIRYKDIEPMHYEIVTCPNCFLSTSAESFDGISKRWMDPLNKKVSPYKLEMYIRTGAERDTFTVFAGYYLALLCAEICFDEHQMVTAGLWLKLSRLYRDCEDQTMHQYTASKALEDYLYAYEHFSVPAKQEQQLCYLIGDLYWKTGNLDKARNYFYQAKINKAGNNVIRRQAELCLDELKELIKK